RMRRPDRLVNKPAGEWQSFDIAFRAARFDGDRKTENARITVYQNGELIHDDVPIPRPTGAGRKEGPDPQPVKLQGHHNPVRFRNVWIQVLDLEGGGDGSADFASRFANPPAGSRILKIIHGWPDAAEAQDAWIRRFTAQGFGGVVCNVSFDQYLESDAHWQQFIRAVRAAREAGFVLWLYDERGYPSGNAGGLVLQEHPEWEARGLLVSDCESGGGAVELAVPPGRLVMAGAWPVVDGRIGLSGFQDLQDRIREGRLCWQAPPGSWRVMIFSEDRLYEGTHADGNLAKKMPYVNLLQPEPIKRFIELTHDRYAAHFGGDLGKDFVATFTDEPSLMSCFLKPMPWRPLPWSANLPGEFEQRRGRPLAHAMLPALVADAGPAGTKFRYDFWQTVGELVSESYFGQIQKRCEHWNIPSGGHLLMEEGLVTHVPFYGD
ncbi:MAG: DUF1080 domain-containing protein, partial [Verrucomicrobiae bacterium]|nr:DUF1080 domain-containing protein [Verrucomicrobiae bacterium]